MTADAAPDTGQRLRLALRLTTAFVIGLVTLTLELSYTRVISFKLFYYYTYFVIGLALLGLGAASSVTALSPRIRTADTTRLVRIVAPLAALAGVIGYVVVARLPIDTFAIWTGDAGRAWGQLFALLGLSVAITGVFFGAGLLLSALFVAEADEVRRLYFWDLAGAALGCLIAVPLQAQFGPPALILGALVVLALLGLFARYVETVDPAPGAAVGTDVVVSDDEGHSREVVVASPAGGRRWGSLVSIGLVVAAIAGAIGAGQLGVRTDDIKTYRDGDGVAYGKWGSVFRVDVVDFGDIQVLLHDGQWGSGIHRYDGTPATTARFDTDSRQIPFAATGEGARVLIIGAAGGHEIQAALTFGAAHVDAVELNPTTVDLLRGRYADYSGNIANDPRVNYVQGDGRTFLARSDDRYDIVWFVAPDSYAANSAATSGAFVLSESYLYTDAMIREAFDHLTDDGVMVAQFGENEFDTRPIRTPRYLVTARDAVSGAIDDDFADHTGLIVEADPEFALVRVSTIMVFRNPPSAATVARVAAAADNVPAARPVYLPGLVEQPSLSTSLITGDDSAVQGIVDDYAFNITPVTDDQPFFWHFTPFGDVVTQYERNYDDSEIAIGERLIVLLLIVAVVVAALALFVPFLVARRGRAESAPLPGRWQHFVYFACLGLGFMFVEISMIQRFALLLGFPTLSLSVSLFTLLIATAIGARGSTLVRRAGWRGPVAATAVLIAVTVLYLIVSHPLTESALAWPQWARIATVFVLLFPVGLLLGVFLPAGIDAVSAASAASGSDRGRNIAWCWAVNGFFSVLGSTLTTMTSMTIGFNRTVLCGLALYVVAATMAVARARREPTPTATTATTLAATSP